MSQDHSASDKTGGADADTGQAADGDHGDKKPDDATKTQDLAKAGRDDFDPNDGQE